MNEKRVNLSWHLLKITYGLLFIVAGIDKFFNLIVDWSKYVNLSVLSIIPLELKMLLLLVGLGEIALGILILFPKWTQKAACMSSLWLGIIALNLFSLKYYDIAIRDIVMAIGALALSILTKARQSD